MRRAVLIAVASGVLRGLAASLPDQRLRIAVQSWKSNRKVKSTPSQSRSKLASARTPIASQTVFDATSLGSPLELDQGWRVGISSDQAVAGPGFDDSKWVVRDARTDINGAAGQRSSRCHERLLRRPHGPPGARLRRYVWFRLHIRLAADHGPVALLIRLPVTQTFSFDIGANGPGVGLRVFANGRMIQPEGPHADAPDRYHEISRIYDLGVPPGETSLVLVIRTLYVPFRSRRLYLLFF